MASHTSLRSLFLLLPSAPRIPSITDPLIIRLRTDAETLGGGTAALFALRAFRWWYICEPSLQISVSHSPRVWLDFFFFSPPVYSHLIFFFSFNFLRIIISALLGTHWAYVLVSQRWQKVMEEEEEGGNLVSGEDSWWRNAWWVLEWRGCSWWQMMLWGGFVVVHFHISCHWNCGNLRGAMRRRRYVASSSTPTTETPQSHSRQSCPSSRLNSAIPDNCHPTHLHLI